MRSDNTSTVHVKPVIFDNLDGILPDSESKVITSDETCEKDIYEKESSLDLIIDVPMQVAIELGKCRKFVKEVLDFNIGTIIVLDKLAGEPVDVVVNGKPVAKGEVVVIDDNYGVRITDIINAANMQKG